MANQTTFGRRATPQRQLLRAAETSAPAPPAGQSAFGEDFAGRAAITPREITVSHVDHELREWKQARKQHSRIPWRQLALMASLCFGIASLVLPDSVNENLDWVLYGLMAASLYAGLSRRLR
jgi:hypothetical protein